MSVIMTCSAIALLLLFYWMYWRWRNRRLLQLAALVPGPPALPILGNALMFMFNPEEILNKITSLDITYGQYYKIWLGPDLNIVVKNPKDIRTLLTSNKVSQKGPLYDLMVPYIGPGILTGGPKWRYHRKIVTPSYNKKAVEHFTLIFNAEAELLASELCKKDTGASFDVYKHVVKCTTQCVNQTLMGLSKQDSVSLHRLDEMIVETRLMYDHIFAKMTRWWLQIPLIDWLSGGSSQSQYEKKLIDDFIGDVVRRRRKALEKCTPDEEAMGVVDRYILAGDMSEEEIKWESFSLFTTSQEAAAKVAAGVLLILAHKPYWQEKVYEEIIEVLGPDTPVSNEDLKRLHSLDLVYKETLRWLSIAALIQRTVEEEIAINDGNIILPAGSSLLVPIHFLHRDPKYWDEPYKVKPERFLPENVSTRDPNAFVPFSLGPMDCLGRVYATALIKTIVVWVLRKSRLEADGNIEDLKLHVAISVSFTDGYNLRTIPRTQKL